MPFFIAKTYEGKVESIVLAKNYELAQAYWQGKKIYAHSVDIKSEEDLKEHITGVLPILNTKEIDGYETGRHNKDKKYLVVSTE